MISVDGTHCRVEEPRPFSTEWSSHKYGGKPAVNYELGILNHKPKLVWCKGSTKPGKQTDLGVFEEELGPALVELGKRAFGDGIYASYTAAISSKNEFDPSDIAKFKNRSLSRHEKFNGLLKNFGVLHGVFRHKHGDLLIQHRKHFLAVVVLVQTQLNNDGFTLWDPYP